MRGRPWPFSGGLHLSLIHIWQEHRSKGMPDELAQILELAGQADVRILILDADAPVLPGLSLAGE